AAETFVLLLLLDAFEIDVHAWIVRGRVWRGTVRDGFDECRSAAVACTVDAHAGHAVPDGLVDERGRARLRRERRRDRPLIVVAEEHARRLHDAREVRALVERALARCA